MKSLWRVKKIYFFILLFSIFSLINPAFVSAETLEVPGELSGSSRVEVADPVQLPNEEVNVVGRGEPNARITISAIRDGRVVFSETTTVNSSGQWQVNLPAFQDDFPTQLIVSSETDITLAKTIETTAVTTAVGASSLVLVQLLIERIVRLLQFIGLLGRKTTKGFVFDVISKKPVPFAILTIENQKKASDTSPQLKETVVTTVDGFFQTVSLPHGKYTITVGHPNFNFPAKLPRPWYATPLEFYQGETVESGGQNELGIFFIPLQPKDSNAVFHAHWLNFQVLRSVSAQVAHALSIPMGVFSVGLLLLYPSFINFAISSLYLVLALLYFLRRFQKHLLQGTVTLPKGEKVQEAVVRVFRTPPEELVTVSLTNKDGQFSTRLGKGEYRLLVSKDGLVPVQEEKMSFETINLSKDQKNLKYTLEKAEEFDWSAANPFEASPMPQSKSTSATKGK